MIRAKFKCESVIKEGENEHLNFTAVTADTEENKSWSKYTPAGRITLTISNPSAQGKFEVDKEYFVDFTTVPAPAVLAEPEAVVQHDPALIENEESTTVENNEANTEQGA